MTDLFDVRLTLYPGANPQADPALWEPYAVDISTKLRHPGNDGGAPIVYSGGKQDEANGVDSGQMTLTLDNRDGAFCTDNLAGPYSGLLDLNTPIRMGVRSWVDTFTRSVSNGWGTVDATLGFSWNVGGAPTWFNVTGSVGTIAIPTANTAAIVLASNGNSGDVDITTTIIPAALATGAAYGGGIIVRRIDASNYTYSTMEFDPAGTVTIKIREVVAGVTTQLASLNPIPASSYSAGQAWKLRTVADGGQVRAMVWAAAGSPPTTWHITATTSGSQAAGHGVGLYLVRFGSNTNAGTTLSVDDFQVTALEFTGGVVSWPVRWDITGNNSWAPITASGILRRLQQGTNPIRSPLYRQLSTTSGVTGYWPLEEPAAAKTFSTTVPGNPVANFIGVTPASDNTLAGGGQAPVITVAGGSITAQTRIPPTFGVSGMAGMFLFKLPSVPATKTKICRFRTNRGIVAFWDLSIDVTGIYTEGYASDGATILTSAVNALPAVDFTQWVAWQLETDNTVGGGNTGWSSITHQVGLTDYWAQTGTFASTITSWMYSAVLTGPVGTAFAHVWFGDNSLPFVDNTFSLVSSGYASELATDRFARVCREADIPYIVRPGGSEAMGVQPKGSTLAILRACEKAEYGAITERGASLEFFPRAARYNLAARMTISKAAGEIDSVPQPVRDDQRLVNKFTMGRSDGGSATAMDQASIDRNGEWESSDTVNVFDDSVLPNHAGWRVFVGTIKNLRWPSIGLNFGRNRTLLPSWRARSYGFRMIITTALGQLTGNDPDVIVEGFLATLWPNGWTVDLNCSATKVWRTAVADDTGILGRVDSDACTTTALISSTTLSIPITTIAGQLKWDNTAGLWSGGVDFSVGGEKITVTSITNGAGQAQTLNATVRGVAGYQASHPSGSAVSLWDPAVVGF